MLLTIEITKIELEAAMAYTNEINNFNAVMMSALGKEKSECVVDKIPTESTSDKNRAYEFKADISPDGLKVTVKVTPEFVADVLKLYAKAFKIVAVPCATFVMALMMCMKQIEGDTAEFVEKWLSEEPKKRTPSKKATKKAS